MTVVAAVPFLLILITVTNDMVVAVVVAIVGFHGAIFITKAILPTVTETARLASRNVLPQRQHQHE